MSYRLHEFLVAPARPTSGLHKLAAGSGMFFALIIGFSALYGTLETLFLSPDGATALSNERITNSTPRSALSSLFLFALMALALGIVLRLVHKRGLFSIIGPWPAFTRQFLSTARVLLVLYVVFYFADMVLPQSDGLEYLPKLSLRDWLLLLPLTLPALLIQTGTEELVFRGYLQSQLAARFSQTWVWLLVPSILFGVLHFDATWGPAFGWALVIWAVGFGLVAADLTARSGTLGPAIAMHLINNFQGIALVAPEDSFDGLALYAYRFPAESDLGILLWLSVNLMVLVCYWLAARLALRC